jgi:putative ABC transport system ATP-binding protein
MSQQPDLPVLQLSGLRRVYGSGATAVTALDGVDLSLTEGEFVAVMGPSGCGKSTLLNLIGGLDAADAGTVRLAGVELGSLDDDRLTELRRREIGFVFQFFNLIPVLSALENAALPMRLDGRSDAEALAGDWLAKVGLAERANARPDQLSGGQQQRVAIARALAADPALLLADEPTGNLDSKSAAEIAGLLRQVSLDWNRTVLMVTHDPVIASHATRLVLMRDGRILDDVALDGSLQAPRLALERAGLL